MGNRKFYTILVNDKFPLWTVDALARSLEDFDVELCCLTDKDSERMPKRSNLSYKNIVDIKNWLGIYFPVNGWWNKLLYFSNELFHEAVIYTVDLDTLFFNDPTDIFEVWNGTRTKAVYTMRDYLNRRKHVRATNLMSIDHRIDVIDILYGLYRDGRDPMRDPRLRDEIKRSTGFCGDQDYISYWTYKLGIGELFDYFPNHFIGSYRLYSMIPDTDIVRARRSELGYDEWRMEDFIGMTFHGKYKFHNEKVLRNSELLELLPWLGEYRNASN